ncbi:hypothetical protein VTL71DRAFT_5520 [Oculimacula yallundae]|uniref:SMP domain-containing protein n=1 Tax=Oculimacula yallundae TaxID=86028 RepID=A0ABR4C1W8_9HELO
MSDPRCPQTPSKPKRRPIPPISNTPKYNLPDTTMSGQGHQMSKEDASRIQSTQGGNDMSSAGFAARAQGAGDRNENANAGAGGNNSGGAQGGGNAGNGQGGQGAGANK